MDTELKKSPPKEKKANPLPKWPSREEYIQSRDEYISSGKNELEGTLVSMGYDKTKVPYMAYFMMVAQHAFRFAEINTPLIKQTKVGIFWRTNLHKKVNAVTGPYFTLNNKLFESNELLYQALLSGEENIQLESIDITVNRNEVERQATRIIDQIDIYKKVYPDELPDKFEENVNELVQDAAKKFIKIVIEEFAHALYFISVSKDRNKLLHAIRDLFDYDHFFEPDEKASTSYSTDEMIKINESNNEKHIEVVAQSLVRMFVSKYLS